MSCCVLKFASLLLIISQLSVAQQQYLFNGDRCALNDRTFGTCRLLNRCPLVQEMILQNRNARPVICSFQGRDPVVCCPRQAANNAASSGTATRSPQPVRPERPTPAPLRPTSAPARPAAPFSAGIDGSSVSEQKCQEYAKAVYVLQAAPTLVDEVVYENRSTCATNEVPLVVGGEPAKLNEYPHMALLGFGSESSPAWLCGGSLISEEWILTAAHCTSSREEGPVKFVRLGELDLANPNDGSQRQTIPVQQRILHPDYRPPAKYNDIALLKLAYGATFTASVRPACLHRLKALPNDGVGIQFVATGWGRIGYNEETSQTLQKVSIRPIPHVDCNRTYRNEATTSSLRRGIDDESMICAGEPEGGKDTCQGDSGGPLQYLRAVPYCMYNVVGVTSFGKFCGFRESPAVYSRVYKYMDWIEQNVWPSTA